MSLWKIQLNKSIREHDETELDLILSQPQVQNELQTISQWNHEAAPLHCATNYGCDSMVEKLLQAGANVNAYFEHGESKFTALHLAALLDKVSIVKILVRFGADQDWEGYGNI